MWSRLAEQSLVSFPDNLPWQHIIANSVIIKACKLTLDSLRLRSNLYAPWLMSRGCGELHGQIKESGQDVCHQLVQQLLNLQACVSHQIFLNKKMKQTKNANRNASFGPCILRFSWTSLCTPTAYMINMSTNRQHTCWEHLLFSSLLTWFSQCNTDLYSWIYEIFYKSEKSSSHSLYLPFTDHGKCHLRVTTKAFL